MGIPVEKLAQTIPGRAILQPYHTQEAEYNRTVAMRRLELNERKGVLDKFKAGPEWDKLSPFQHHQFEMWAATPGTQIPTMPFGAMTPRLLSSRSMGESAPPGTVEYGTNKPVQAGMPYRVEMLPGTGETIWQPIASEITTGTNAQGEQGTYNRRNGQLIAPLGGSVAPAVVNANVGLHQGTTPTGKLEFKTGKEINQGNYQNPAYAPINTTSVQQIPGQLPQVTHTTRSRGAGAQSTGGGTITPIQPPAGGGGASNSLEQRKYQDWVDGKSSPTGKELTAVQDYAARNNLPSPTALSASGSKDLERIDDVLAQIKRIKGQMEKMGLANDTSRDKYADYFRAQRLGEATPLGSLWTDLAFEGLRSGGAAMQGISTRGQMIFNKAMEHVPRPTMELNPAAHEPMHIPDTPARMYQKLGEMEKILSDSRQQVLSDERKTGIPGVSGGSSVPPAVQKALSGASAGRHTLSDGSVWLKMADGTITKE
jgi:hypothetical protein